MLSRVADNLFWMGRYIERTEHLARFTRIQYFYSLDGPLARQWDTVLQSIIGMTGLEWDASTPLAEADVLYAMALDGKRPESILYSVIRARENARGTRDLLSKELWENINKYYHFVHNYPVEVFKSRGLHEFTLRVIEQCSIIRGSVDNTLLHDEVWTFIKLGSYLERAVQVARILETKFRDLETYDGPESLQKAVENYQLSTMLGSTEAFDMSRRYFQAPPSREQVLEFLVLNQDFPRSIVNCLTHVETYIHKLSPTKVPDKDSVAFFVSKLVSRFRFLTGQEVFGDALGFMQQTVQDIYAIGEKLNDTYLKY
ncbi:MAG: alpha-E domain-containing protein [Bacteroidia bacterium]